MGFEDDLFEYGFNDGHDYIDYLMDKADQEWERLERRYNPKDKEASSHSPFLESDYNRNKYKYKKIVKDEKYGYADLEGNIIIECKYDYIKLFDSNVAIVKMNDKYGVINLNQEIIVPIVCQSIKQESCAGFWNNTEYVVLRIEKIPCYIDVNGIFIPTYRKSIRIPSDYMIARKSKFNLIAVCKNNKWGFIDENLNVIIPCIYEDVKDFEIILPCLKVFKRHFVKVNGITCNLKEFVDVKDFLMCPVKSNNLWGTINVNGEIVIKNKYSNMDIESSYGWYVVCQFRVQRNDIKIADVDHVGRLNYNGDLEVSGGTIPCKYDWGSEYENGHAIVQLNDKLGLIDKHFNEIIPCMYDDIRGVNFNNGLILVMRGLKYGYVNDSGEEVIPCIYDSATFFSKGKATVSKDGCKYAIDINGVLYNIE